MNSFPARAHNPTKKQLVILSLLYRFRFASSDHISKTLNADTSSINKRLRLLMGLNYIGRKYEPEYHLLRKHAAYYLLPDGTRALKKLSSKRYPPAVLRNINRDRHASERFVRHQLTLLTVFCTLRARYGGELQFFTKSQLAGPSYFPDRLPDAYVQLGKDSHQKFFFLDLFHEDQRFFLATRRIMQYIAYAELEKWPARYRFPRILLVCDSSALQKHLVTRMRRVIGDTGNERLQFFVTNMGELQSDNPWHDMAEPDHTYALPDL